MMDVLQGIGYGIVGFAILVVVGIVVLSRLGGGIANCASTEACGSAGVFNYTLNSCSNATDACGDPTNSGWSNSNYLSSQLGSSGLSGWVPAIIAVAVGALFLSYFMGRKRK